MKMQIIGLIIIAIIGGYFFYSVKKSNKSRKDNKQKKGKNPKKEDKETVQELFEYKSITDNGIVQLNDGTFTATLEVSQINQRLNNGTENTSIWRKFRSLINALSIRHTLIVQSQYLDLADFVNNYESESEQLENITDQLKEARKEVLASYRNFSELKTKEVRCYVIFRFNPYKDNQDKGLDTGNAALNTLITATKNKANQMTEEEAEDLAQSILDEVTDLAYQLFHSIGIKSVRLNRTGILNMVYMTLNRDLMLGQRLQDAANARSFSEFKSSDTPFIIEELAELESLKMQGYDVIPLRDVTNDEEIQEGLEQEELKAMNS